MDDIDTLLCDVSSVTKPLCALGLLPMRICWKKEKYDYKQFA